MYDDVAEKLQKKKIADPPIPCIKVDATKNPMLSQQYQITGYPWLKLFINGEPINYPDNMARDTAEPIVAWAQKISGRSIKKVEYSDELSALRTKHPILVLGVFGKRGEGARAAGREELLQVARDDQDGTVFALHEPDAVEEGVTHESILLESLADDLFADVPAIDRIMADDPLEFAIRAPSVSAHRPRAAQISVLTRRLSVHRLWSFVAVPVTSRWLRACRPPTCWRSAGRRLRQRRRGRR